MSDVVVKAIGVEEDVMSFVVVLEKLVRLVGRGLRNWWAVELWLVYSSKLDYACGSHGLAIWSVRLEQSARGSKNIRGEPIDDN